LPSFDKLPASHVAALAREAQGKPEALLKLARLIAGDPNQAATVRGLARQALEAAPDDPATRTEAADLLSHQVASWHFTIVHDERRNHDYEAALRKAVTPCSRVLDIGAGTGLLAMMAARAGAARVTSCEVNPAIAEAAAEIVAANGLSDRVAIVPRHSGALTLDRDLGGERVDVIVSETISNDVVSQHWLESIKAARADLAAPDVRIIPCATAMRVALAEDRTPLQVPMGAVAGFDLSRFNLYAPPRYQVRTGGDRIVLRSAPETLVDFDFRQDEHPSDFDCELIADGGLVNGIAQWVSIAMDADIVYENDPGQSSCWALLFYPFAEPRKMGAGERIRIRGRRSRDKILIWAEEQA
jgi:type II protein arginine methyltransferase